jgi:hypothetical protein
MTVVALLVWEIRAIVRGWVPMRALRYAAASALLMVTALMTATLVLVPSSVQRGSTLSADGVAAMIVLLMSISIAAALAGGVGQLRAPERWQLLRLAPLPDYIRTFLPTAAMIILGTAACGVVVAPFIIVSMSSAPRTAALLALMGACAAAWSVVLALSVLVCAARLLGRQRAAAFAGALPLTFVVLAPWSVRSITRIGIERPALSLGLLASFVMIPIAGRWASRAFVALLQTADEPRVFPEPEWGRPSWMRRLLRTDAPWGMVGFGLLALISAASGFPARWGTIALLLIGASTTPLWHLWKAEYECPDRWRLAPEAGRMRRSLLLQVGGTSAAVAFAIALVLGWDRPMWVMQVALLLVLAPFTFLVYARWLRGTLQVALLLAAVLTGAS